MSLVPTARLLSAALFCASLCCGQAEAQTAGPAQPPAAQTQPAPAAAAAAPPARKAARAVKPRRKRTVMREPAPRRVAQASIERPAGARCDNIMCRLFVFMGVAGY